MTWSRLEQAGQPEEVLLLAPSRAPPLAARTRRRRRAPGRTSPRTPAPRRRSSSAGAVGVGCAAAGEQRLLRASRGRPRAPAAGRARGRARAPSRPRAAAATGPTAGTPTPSRRAAGPGRTGRPPGRRTAGSRSRSRRRRPTAAGCRRPRRPSAPRPSSARSESANSSIRRSRPGRRTSTTVGCSPVTARKHARRRPAPGGGRRDDQAAGVGDVPADLGRAAGRPPSSTAGIQSPAGSSAVRQACAVSVLGQRLAEGGLDLVAGPGAPAHRAGVGQEDHRPDDAVAQRLGVAVGVVGGAARHAVAVRARSRRTGSG